MLFVLGKNEIYDPECGTSTSNIGLQGTDNIGNKDGVMMKTEDSTTPENEYLSYINSSTHFMISEEVNIKTEYEYQEDELQLKKEDDLDTG